MKDHYRKLLDYHDWANQLFIAALQENPHPQAGKILSHLLHAQRIWLLRIAGQPAAFDFWAALSPAAWPAYHQRDQEDTLKLLDERELDAEVVYRNSRGEAYQNTIRDILQHLLNHATHHRAQIALLLRQQGIAPPLSDYIYYLRRSDGETGRLRD